MYKHNNESRHLVQKRLGKILFSISLAVWSPFFKIYKLGIDTYYHTRNNSAAISLIFLLLVLGLILYNMCIKMNKYMLYRINLMNFAYMYKKILFWYYINMYISSYNKYWQYCKLTLIKNFPKIYLIIFLVHTCTQWCTILGFFTAILGFIRTFALVWYNNIILVIKLLFV